MELANLLVTSGGFLLIGVIAWFFWGPKKEGIPATLGSSGIQEAQIRVKNGYSPNRIIAQRGKPIRFVFFREEKVACSEMVVFPDFQKSATLPTGKKVIIELPPMEDGIYDFTCQMGMYRGKVIVK